MNASAMNPRDSGSPPAPAPGRAMAALAAAATHGERVMGVICWIQGVAASLSVAGMVLLLVGSSLRRYVFGKPIPVTEELGALLFVTLAFLSITEGFMADRQVRIQLVWRLLPRRVKGWAMIAGHGLSVFALVLIIRATWEFAFFSYQVGAETYITEILMWPWMMLIPISLGILAAATVVRMLVDLHAVLSGDPVKEERVALDLEL